MALTNAQRLAIARQARDLSFETYKQLQAQKALHNATRPIWQRLKARIAAKLSFSTLTFTEPEWLYTQLRKQSSLYEWLIGSRGYGYLWWELPLTYTQTNS